MDTQSKIYIAGHRGLVGSAIWRGLAEQGYTHLIGRTHAQLDLLDAQAVSNFFEEERPEYVFLAAAKVGGIVANNTYRAQFLYENLCIQNNIIHNAYKYGTKKLLFLGSTCIYPKEAPQPIPEDALLTGMLEYTNEPYAIAKIAGIKLCESYNLQYGTNFISVMPTNLYGPHDNFNLETSHVLPALIRKAHIGLCLINSDWESLRKDLNARPIESVNGESSTDNIIEIVKKYGVYKNSNDDIVIHIWGTGAPLREFLWSEDLADACIYCMHKVDFRNLHTADIQAGKDIRNTHINIGTGKEISIKNLAHTIAQHVGFTGLLQFDTSKPDGTMRKLTDPSKINSLGWTHKVDIDAGIAKLYEWYKNSMN